MAAKYTGSEHPQKAGHLDTAAEHHARAAAATRSTAERDHLTKQAARLHGASH